MKKAYKLLIDYLDLFKETNEYFWEVGKDSQIWTNTGIQGLMLLFEESLEYLSTRDKCFIQKF